MKRRLVLVTAALSGLLLALLLVRALTAPSRQRAVPPAPGITVDQGALARTLAGALRLRTISFRDPARFDRAAFSALHSYLAEAFPHLTARAEREVVDGLSLLYRWPGSDAKAAPILLMAHLDVVPVQTPKAWTHPPFAGTVADGAVWGRGALDIKGSLVAMLAAADRLIQDGFVPRRTVYFALGHDEEVSGAGNRAIVALLKERGVRLDFVLDEGLMIVDGVVPGLSKPAALIGVGEKGYLTLRLAARGEAGHSSRPPRHTAVGILAAALARLEQNPFPAAIDGPTRQMFETLAPEMGFGLRLALTNLWLLEPVVLRTLTAKASTAASVRTTTAPTMLRASPQENVLAAEAEAMVNFRIMPGQSIASVVAMVGEIVDDERVTVAPLASAMNSEPPPVSRVSARGYGAVERAVRETFPEALVSPGLMIATTDSRWYTGLSKNIYRFSPVVLRSAGIATIHGENERIGVKALARMARCYGQVLRHGAGE